MYLELENDFFKEFSESELIKIEKDFIIYKENFDNKKYKYFKNILDDNIPRMFFLCYLHENDIQKILLIDRIKEIMELINGLIVLKSNYDSGLDFSSVLYDSKLKSQVYWIQNFHVSCHFDDVIFDKFLEKPMSLRRMEIILSNEYSEKLMKKERKHLIKYNNIKHNKNIGDQLWYDKNGELKRYVPQNQDTKMHEDVNNDNFFKPGIAVKINLNMIFIEKQLRKMLDLKPETTEVFRDLEYKLNRIISETMKTSLITNNYWVEYDYIVILKLIIEYKNKFPKMFKNIEYNRYNNWYNQRKLNKEDFEKNKDLYDLFLRDPSSSGNLKYY